MQPDQLSVAKLRQERAAKQQDDKEPHQCTEEQHLLDGQRRRQFA
jgi:hypothetical protein